MSSVGLESCPIQKPYAFLVRPDGATLKICLTWWHHCNENESSCLQDSCHVLEMSMRSASHSANTETYQEADTEPFRLLDLPFELRIRIYEYVFWFPAPIRPRRTYPSLIEVTKHARDSINVFSARTRLFCNRAPYENRADHEDEAGDIVQFLECGSRSMGGVFNITLVSRQLHSEALSTFYAVNIFDFGSVHGPMLDFFEALRARGRLGLLRRVRFWIPTMEPEEGEFYDADYHLQESLALLVRARLGPGICFSRAYPVLTLSTAHQLDSDDLFAMLRWELAMENFCINLKYIHRPDLEYDASVVPQYIGVEWRLEDQDVNGRTLGGTTHLPCSYFCDCTYQADVDDPAPPPLIVEDDTSSGSEQEMDSGDDSGGFANITVTEYDISKFMDEHFPHPFDRCTLGMQNPSAYWGDGSNKNALYPSPPCQKLSLTLSTQTLDESEDLSGPQHHPDKSSGSPNQPLGRWVCKDCCSLPVDLSCSDDLIDLARLGECVFPQRSLLSKSYPDVSLTTADAGFVSRWTRDITAYIGEIYKRWDGDQPDGENEQSLIGAMDNLCSPIT